MKTNIINIKHLCALLMMALTFAACSSDADDIVNQPEPQQPAADGIHFTAVFGVKNAGTTRALTDPGNGTLTASWQTGEEIAIIFGGNKYTAIVTDVDANGSATVSATLPSGTPNNQAVTFIYPASAADGSGLLSDLLSEQDGTLATLSSTLDVATADGNLVVSGTTAQPNGSVSLENQFAICKLQFKDESDAAITDITKLTINYLATGKVITVMPQTAQSALYVAMEPGANSVEFVVEKSDGQVYKKVSNSNLQAGKFYHPTLSASLYNPKSIPLTFEAIEDCTIKFDNNAQGSLYYTIEGGESGEFHSWYDDDWTENESISLTAGQKVSFYGDNETYGDWDETPQGSNFSISGDCYVYGNIMSLISSTNYTDLKVLTRGGNFTDLFNGCSHLKSHPDKQLLLPATTLTDCCYYRMFYECSGLTKAPALPATSLANAYSCYYEMFLGCTGLTTAPDLPATTLESHCYELMFLGCIGLTTAPDLPATTLVEGCYAYMFYGCTNLNSVKCLATSLYTSTNNWSDSSTEKWLDGVASNGTFTKAASMTDWPSGISGIPSGWTVENE